MKEMTFEENLAEFVGKPCVIRSADAGVFIGIPTAITVQGGSGHMVATFDEVRRAWRWTLKKGISCSDMGLADRGTFVIDPDGEIQLIEITPEGVGRSAAELVRKVKAAIYVRQHPNEVCPAKWEEGAATLTPGLDLVGKI